MPPASAPAAEPSALPPIVGVGALLPPLLALEARGVPLSPAPPLLPLLPPAAC
jgi:hypothetical protein